MALIMNTKKLVSRQLEEMAKHKWIESEKAGRDLGEQAMLDWIDKYLEKFQEEVVKDKEKS